MVSKVTAIKLRLLWENGKRCAICGKKIKCYEELTVDHIIPLGKGGSNDIDNCQLAHRECNAKKGSIMPDRYEQILRYNRRVFLKKKIRQIITFW